MSHDSLRSKGRRSRKISRTDSELACEEAAKLTAELHDDANDDEDDDDIDYNELPPPPDGGYGWVICAASFLCNMIVDGIAYTFGVFLNNFAEHFQVGNGTVSWAGSLLSGMYLTAGPVVSALCNKFGCRAVCIGGSVLACVAFVLSTFSPTVGVLMLTYGVMGGIGFGMIYLPAVVAVGYYFEKKRSLATGIAVCGSGFGTFAFAPIANYLLETFGGWQGANLVLAGIILNCAIFGALMRPLTYPKKKKDKPLMQRMYEEKRMQMERGSISGSYFNVTMPDGSVKQKMKTPLNADPGVHSSLALDQLANQQIHPVATLPTITETTVQDANGNGKLNHNVVVEKKSNGHLESETNDNNLSVDNKNIPRNASQPVFSSNNSGIPKNGSVPSFNRSRKTSETQPYKPTLGTITDGANVRNEKRNSISSLPASLGGSKYSLNDDEEFEFTSKTSLSQRKSNMVRPLSRKDIFYSGSVTNLKEYQSQKSLTDYRNSVVSLTRFEKEHQDAPRYTKDVESPPDPCPCLNLPPAFKAALASMMDVTLLKDPAFMLIGVSNLFGMAALYIPFFFLVDAANKNGLEPNQASSLLSIIGITNIIARIACGAVADLPSVDALFLNNICLVICTITVGITPFCASYTSYIVMVAFFGVGMAGYISLTSIILVDLLGLEKLTNAFGLLILFRGAAAIFGTPIAGAIYDATGSYDIPFFTAGALFGLSAITSFLAPWARKRWQKSEATTIHIDEVLTPIEENEEEYDEDSQPITMIPKIVKTAPSPSTEKPPMNGKSKDLQMESVL